MRPTVEQRTVAPPARRVLTLAAAMALAAGLFLAGRWSATGEPAALLAEGRPAPGAEAAAPAAGSPRALSPPLPAAGRTAPRPLQRPAASPEVVGLATEGARGQLESARASLVSQCWPGGPLGRGPEKTRLTFHLTFDAAGREVARGIAEDRGAPAGAFASCLRRLPAGTLTIPAPGARVGVRVAMSFP
jgi:hypothetical protein